MRLLCMGRLIPGAFQFLDRLPGRASAKVNANAHCARESPKCPDTRGLRPRRIPELARALEPTLILRAGRLHRPAAQRFLPLLRTPILPPLLVLLQMDHPTGPPFRARNGPPAAPAPSVPASTRGDGIPLEGRVTPRAGGYDSVEGPVPPGPRDAVERVPPQGRTTWKPSSHWKKTGGSGGIRPPRRPAGRPSFIPARPTQRRQAAAVHALPRPRTAPPNLRSVCRRGGRWQAQNPNPPSSRWVPLQWAQWTC